MYAHMCKRTRLVGKGRDGRGGGGGGADLSKVAGAL